MKIYYFFLSLTLLVSILWVKYSYSALPLQNENSINECLNSDEKIICVGSIILSSISDLNKKLSDDTSSSDFSMKVNFYNSKECSRKLQAVIFYTEDSQNNANICQFKSRFISSKTLSLKINGICENIKKIDFLTACEKYYK